VELIFGLVVWRVSFSFFGAVGVDGWFMILICGGAWEIDHRYSGITATCLRTSDVRG